MVDMTEETRVALLELNMTEIKTEMAEIRSDIKSLSKQLDTLLSAKMADQVTIQAQIKTLQETTERMQRQSDFWRWFSPTLSGLICLVLGSVITFLVIAYIGSLHK